MSAPHVSKVLGIAVRSAKNGPMREVVATNATVDAGLDGDLKVESDRGVTFISAVQWRETMQELGVDIPWHTRRANVLVDAARLATWIGQTVRIGPVTLDIKGETRPCGLMDEFQPGLRNALKPECRAGVHGRVITGGTIRVGDEISVPAPR